MYVIKKYIYSSAIQQGAVHIRLMPPLGSSQLQQTVSILAMLFTMLCALRYHQKDTQISAASFIYVHFVSVFIRTTCI